MHKKILNPLIILSFITFFVWGMIVGVVLYIYNSPIQEQEQETPDRYLQSQESVEVQSKSQATEENAVKKETATELLPIESVLFEYIEVVDSCGSDFSGDCLNVRSGPGEDFEVVSRLREGVVLKVGGEVRRYGEKWYKIVFDEWIRYPNRITSDWYIKAEYVRILKDEGILTLGDQPKKETNKKIVVNQTEQTLRAYENGDLFMEEIISTGIELTPTPYGTFTIFRKTPTRYMQGPLPGISNRHWDLPGVPWNLYFTQGGAVIHGTYWHNDFGQRASNGCVNIHPEKARELYNWADIGTTVIIE